MLPYKITNVKVSIKTSAIVLNNVSVNANTYLKNFVNYIVIKSTYTYIIFKTNSKGENHINVTKIPALEKIVTAIKHLQELITCCEIKIKKIIVDNICATFNVGKKINLIKICQEHKFNIIKYNNETFPGLFVRFKSGSANIFHSGAIVILGGKNIKHIECLIANICANI